MRQRITLRVDYCVRLFPVSMNGIPGFWELRLAKCYAYWKLKGNLNAEGGETARGWNSATNWLSFAATYGARKSLRRHQFVEPVLDDVDLRHQGIGVLHVTAWFSIE